MFNNRKFKYINESNNQIKIISYNILAPIVIKSSNKHLQECPEDCIDWNYRFNLIKKEIKEINPDIISFQEVQFTIAYEDIFPYFNKIGYIGFFRTQEIGWMNNFKVNIGVIILFKKNKFECLKYGFIDYKNVIKKYVPKKLQDKASQRFSCIILKLKIIDNKKKFFIATTHLESNPDYHDVINFQAYILMKHLNKITENHKIPLIISGDFNSSPTSSVYKAITTGLSDIKYTNKNNKNIINIPKTFSKYVLKSSYFEVFGKEPKFTNYTYKFKSTLDYIFINKKVKIIGALEELNTKYLENKKSIPNYDFPSDHFLQCSVVEII